MKTKQWYKLKMMTHGVISILLVLKYFESQEIYEECQVIKELLLDHGFELKVTQDLIDEVVNHHRGSWSRSQVLEANRYYSEIIINDALGSYEVLEIPPCNI